jgi:hypothetical protein
MPSLEHNMTDLLSPPLHRLTRWVRRSLFSFQSLFIFSHSFIVLCHVQAHFALSVQFRHSG